MIPKKEKKFNFPEVRIVEASAGSGKTYALAKRYIELLFNPDLKSEQIPIRNILAVTFTNKAAFEMKARILDFIKKIAILKLSEEEYNSILKPLGVTRDQAKEKAFGIIDDLIHHYNFFQVQTIDKFINALLSGCAFRINLTANFKIKTNYKEYLEYSLDELIDSAFSNKEIFKVFEYFLNNYLYLENRTGWFPKQDMLSILCSLFNQNNSHGSSFKDDFIVFDDILKKKRKTLEQINLLKEILPDGIHIGFLKSLDSFLANNVKGFDIDSIPDYFAREDIPSRKVAKIPIEVDKLWGKINKNLKQICIIEAYSLFDPYILVYKKVIDKFYEYCSRQDVLFLSELNKKARQLFDEEGITVEELYYRLATRFHHYLIDEFQDTSRLQWKNLMMMPEEALSTGGSLYYVGDKKQAIYGFRGGDVELFDEVRDIFGDFNVQVESLTNNYRSQKEIVEFNNQIFSPENLENFIFKKEEFENEKKKTNNKVIINSKDLSHIKNIFSEARQTFQKDNDKGYVKIEHIDIDKKDERDEEIRNKLVSLIKGLKKRFSNKDIAILARTNTQVEQITNWLLEENIQIESERTSNIKKNANIQELLAFMRFLISPNDNFSFSFFIMGEIFSKISGLSFNQMQEFVFKYRDAVKINNEFMIYKKFINEYKKEWEDLIGEFFNNAGLYPLYELVVSIFSKFKCFDNFSYDQGFFMHFLEIVKKSEDEFSDMASFVEYFDNLEGEKLFVSVKDKDAIKILTIHKAKGLEFPVVILPFLSMDIQVGSQGQDNKQPFVIKHNNSYMELIRLKEKYYKFSDELYKIYRYEYIKSLTCELNNIYVALTRPKKELYGFIPKRVRNNFNFAKFLIPEDIYEKGQIDKTKIFDREEESFYKLPYSQFPDWLGYLKDEFLGVDDLRNKNEKLKGEIMHYLLSYFKNIEHEDKNVLIKKSLDDAKYLFNHVESFDEYKNILAKLIDKEELRDIFYCGKNQVFTEKEIVTSLGYTKRIDRLIIKDDEVLIIDYKSKFESKEYSLNQIKEYIEIMKSIYSNLKVRGFLLYLDELKLEEIYG